MKNPYLSRNRHKRTDHATLDPFLGKQGCLVIRCMQVETCETNLLIALCLSPCLPLSPQFPSVCFNLCPFQNQDGNSTPASCIRYLCHRRGEERFSYFCYSFLSLKVYKALYVVWFVKLSKFIT